MGQRKGVAQSSQAWTLVRDGLRRLFDPLIRFADAQVNDESRDAAIGMDVTRRLLFVVHLLREDDCLRIISARMATATERKAYEDYD